MKQLRLEVTEYLRDQLAADSPILKELFKDFIRNLGHDSTESDAICESVISDLSDKKVIAESEESKLSRSSEKRMRYLAGLEETAE